MNRPWTQVLMRLSLLFTSVWVGFVVLIDRWRTAEAAFITSILQGIGISSVRNSFENQILVVPGSHRPFLANISTSCSALAAVLAFGAIAAFMVKGRAILRLRAFVASGLLVFGCNVLRIALSVLAGVELGSRGLVIFHDWVGTGFGIVYVLGGFTLFIFMLLPSNAQLLKEALGND